MVELKARVDNLEEIRNKLSQIGVQSLGTFHQVDTYYKVPTGRLKLREIKSKPGAELIYYEREDIAKPKKSSILILAIPHHHDLKQTLKRILGTKAIVDKTREIYHHQGIQIHLDKVKNLGSFVEFELETSQNSNQRNKDISKLAELRERLNIDPACLQKLSYSELI